MTVSTPKAERPSDGSVTTRAELPVYLVLVATYFCGFGAQMVFFPYLIAIPLAGTPPEVGFAQMASQLPMLFLLLWGGLLAERKEARSWMIQVHLFAMIPPLLLIAALMGFGLSYPIMLAYGCAMGVLAAMVMPARDAALNAIVARDNAAGHPVSFQKAVTLATAAQTGAQVLGIIAGGFASAIGAIPLLIGQAIMFGLGAIAAFFMSKQPKPINVKGRGIAGALSDIGEGLSEVRRSKIVLPMVLSGGYIGVFIIGSFSVLFPIIVRDVYERDSQALSYAFMAFWIGSFLSTIVLSRRAPFKRPGRALLISQFGGASALAIFALAVPFPLFVFVIFCWGLCAGVGFSMSRTITQQEANPAYLGRILAIYSLGYMGGAPIGAALMGWAAAFFGPQLSALVPAIGMTTAILIMIRFTAIWGLERRTGS